MQSLGSTLKKPEYRLALEITGVILGALLTVALVAGVGVNFVDQKRLAQIFEMREEALSHRQNVISTMRDFTPARLENQL